MAVPDDTMSPAERLRRRIARAEAELADLKAQLADAEADEAEDQRRRDPELWKWPLKTEEYERYSRQLILPAVGVQGQLRLRDAAVLIVGAGGLGCPAAAYLAGAGVGHIGLVDGDTVEASNLHRQIGHATGRVGTSKVASLAAYLRQLNPQPRYTTHAEPLTPANAARLVAAYGLVLDCTDHPAVRYLVSDACVRAGRPLVSAAALRTDGQLAVLNWPVGQGPCYRCVFPRPPPPASQLSCAEGGILGPVVGVMGVLQALEAIRIIVSGLDSGRSSSGADSAQPSAEPPTLLLFSGAAAGSRLGAPSFRTVRLRGRRPDCFACSKDAPLKKMQSLQDVGSSSGSEEAWPDYVQFCSSAAPDRLRLKPDERIGVAEFSKLHSAQGSDDDDQGHKPRHWLLDVREKEFYDMGSLDGALNIPFSKIQAAIAKSRRKAASSDDENGQKKTWPEWLPEAMAADSAPVYLLCRVGNDSQTVACQMKELGLDRDGARFIGDIQGGIQAWKAEIDRTMPFV